MVSAGIDTVPANLVMCIALLSSVKGQEIQKKALGLIQKVYPNGEAWEKCLVEEKVPYITALVKETLRFWTVIPICLPRVNLKDIPYEGAVIPAGTTFFMVRAQNYIINGWQLDSNHGTVVLTHDRTHGQLITMSPTTSPRTILTRNDFSAIPRSGRRTTATAPDLACARDRISRTGSSIRPSSA